jgi:hypothetical protein
MSFYVQYNGAGGGGGSGGAGVTSLNSLTGALTLVAGTDITITPDGSNIIIDCTAGSPTGDPLTVAIFDAAGDISSDPNFTFDAAQNLSVVNTSEGSPDIQSGLALGSFAHIAIGGGGSVPTVNFGTSKGAFVSGYLQAGSVTGGLFQATGNGASVFGWAGGSNSAASTSGIYAQGGGSFAGGWVDGEDQAAAIQASSQGSFNWGWQEEGATSSVTGLGAAMFSYADGSTTTSGAGDGSLTQGHGHLNDTYLASAFGRFSDIVAVDDDVWTSTDTLFAIGNGADVDNRANALHILKDGSMFLSGFIGTIDSASTSSNLTLQTGTGATLSGDVQLITGAGASSASSGAVSLLSGEVEDGDSGSVAIDTGIAVGNGNTGTITLTTGIAIGNGNTGDILLQTGEAIGSGTRGSIQLNSHILSDGPVVTVDEGADAGSGAVASLDNAESTDTAGVVSIVTGSGATDGEILEVIFAEPYSAPPVVIISGANFGGGEIAAYVSSVTANGFIISSAAGISDATTYLFNYYAIGLV